MLRSSPSSYKRRNSANLMHNNLALHFFQMSIALQLPNSLYMKTLKLYFISYLLTSGRLSYRINTVALRKPNHNFLQLNIP